MRKNITGERFSRLLIVGVSHRSNGKLYWKALCDCGATTAVPAARLNSGMTTSCGCYNKEVLSAANEMRSKSAVYLSKEYRSWQMMRQRCENPKNPKYSSYGGRGISVCYRWKVFSSFLDDMGKMPDGFTLDRIDVNGNYNPDNCRWASRKDQQRNRRVNVLLEVDGATRCITEWAEIKQLKTETIRNRIRKGWSAYDAVMTRPFASPETQTPAPSN